MLAAEFLLANLQTLLEVRLAVGILCEPRRQRAKPRERLGQDEIVRGQPLSLDRQRPLQAGSALVRRAVIVVSAGDQQQPAGDGRVVLGCLGLDRGDHLVELARQTLQMARPLADLPP